MFDTHCHLQDKAFATDLDAIVTDAAATGVTHILAPATDLASFERTIELTKAYKNVYGALGLHPHTASEWSQNVRAEIIDQCSKNSKIRAIGEIGLDYHYNFSPPEVQRQAFSDQIELAQQLQMPIVVHIRESDEDVFSILEERYRNADVDTPRGQLHCFSSTVERMQQAVELGFHISFTGNITFKKSTLDSVVRETPMERLLIETDSPYLTPHPFRGQRNSPAQVRLVAEKVAELKALDLTVVLKQTFENALRFFRITPSLLVLGFVLFASEAMAQREQPAGAAPPDSVMTPERRRAEELRKQQEVLLAKEAEQRRQDSIKAAEKDQAETIARIREQQRQDSIKASQRILEEQEHEAFLQTPMPWKAVGLGFAAGISDMPMVLGTRTLIPLSVFSYTIDASSAITRRLDINLNFSHMTVGEPFPQDSMYAYGLLSHPATGYNPAKNFTDSTRLIFSEFTRIQTYAADLRYVITKPSSVLKFYFGAGYIYHRITNEQHYSKALDATHSDGTDRVLTDTWTRGGFKLLFGMRHDFEIGAGLTLEPFSEISMISATSGDSKELPSFAFGADPTVMTQFNAGFTLYYGWFGVQRDK